MSQGQHRPQRRFYPRRRFSADLLRCSNNAAISNMKLQMGMNMTDSVKRETWIDPEVRDLDVQETNAQPGPGADVGGNAFPDCQAS
jgi:hypothetical protein